MKNRREYRPCVSRAELEDRVVLSQANSALATFPILLLPGQFGNDGSALGKIRNQYIHQFQIGYANLGNTLMAAAQADLPSGNTDALTTQLEASLNALDASIDAMLSLSPLAQRHLTPTIDDSLIGDGQFSLKSQLESLPPAFGTSTPEAIQGIQQAAVSLINDSLRQNVRRLIFFFSDDNPERQAIRGADRAAPPLAQIHDSYATQFQAAFSTFGQSYTDAATTFLGSGTTADALAAARPDFDAHVAKLADVLTAELTSMLAISPLAQFSLTPQVQRRLIGTGSESMLSQLAAISTPSDTSNASLNSFRSQSTAVIQRALDDILNDLDTFFLNRRAGIAQGTESAGDLDPGFGGDFNGFGNVFGVTP